MRSLALSLADGLRGVAAGLAARRGGGDEPAAAAGSGSAEPPEAPLHFECDARSLAAAPPFPSACG